MSTGLESLELALTECMDGEEAEIADITVDSSLATRLRELGLISGGIVRVARQGSPMILEIGTARVCLRGEEAARITVRVPAFPEQKAAVVGSSVVAPKRLAQRPEWA